MLCGSFWNNASLQIYVIFFYENHISFNKKQQQNVKNKYSNSIVELDSVVYSVKWHWNLRILRIQKTSTNFFCRIQKLSPRSGKAGQWRRRENGDIRPAALGQYICFIYGSSLQYWNVRAKTLGCWINANNVIDQHKPMVLYQVGPLCLSLHEMWRCSFF